MPNVKCFFVKPTDRVALALRRFVWSERDKCQTNYGYHNAMCGIGEAPLILEDSERGTLAQQPMVDHADPRWPKVCVCGYKFTDSDQWQMWQDRIYRAPDGKEWPLRDLPVGAMYYADWMPSHWRGPDGHALVVITPGGVWHVDSQANNCTKPDDHEHRCWVRHGDPETGQVHVDKDGNTCAAGAGSIMSGSYHGFLHNGELTDC